MNLVLMPGGDAPILMQFRTSMNTPDMSFPTVSPAITCGRIEAYNVLVQREGP